MLIWSVISIFWLIRIIVFVIYFMVIFCYKILNWITLAFPVNYAVFLSEFLKDRKQRVTLNGQVSSWTGVHGLSSVAKLLADFVFSSLFSVIRDVDISVNELMICIKSINGLPNNKRAFTQTQAIRIEKLFLVEN